MSQLLVIDCQRVSPVTVACHRLSGLSFVSSALAPHLSDQHRCEKGFDWRLFDEPVKNWLFATRHCHSKENKWFENLTLLNCYNINEKVKSVKKGNIIWYRTHQSLSMECTKQSIFESLSSMLTRTGLIRGRTPNYNSPALSHFHKRDGYPDLQKMSKT